MTKHGIGRLVAVIAVTAGLAGGAMAGGEGGPVATRQAAMKTVGKNFKPLVGMVKGEVPFDAAAVKRHAAAIVENLKKARANFPEGSEEGETRAMPEIWLLEDEFRGIFDRAVKLAAEVGRVEAQKDLAPAVLALGGKGCKACHEKFRLPKKDK